MDNTFGCFPEIPDINVKGKDQAENQSKNPIISSEDFEKLIKKMKKQKKSHKKLQKKIRKLTEELSASAMSSEPEKDGANKFKKGSSTNASPQKEKTFLWKLGDAVVKAIPGILSTAVTVIATILIGQPPKPPRKFREAVM